MENPGFIHCEIAFRYLSDARLTFSARFAFVTAPRRRGVMPSSISAVVASESAWRISTCQRLTIGVSVLCRPYGNGRWMRLALVVEAINGAMDCALKSVRIDESSVGEL